MDQQTDILLKKLVELCPIGVVGVNRQGLITIFNPAAERLSGLSAGQVLGRLNIAEFYISPQEARRVKKLLHGPERGGVGRLEGEEVAVKDAQGQAIPIELWAFILFEDGQEVGSAGFFHDLRDHKRAEESRLMQEKLKATLEMAGAVLHHLSQPLQVLVSDASILLQEIPADSDVRDSVEAIAQGVNDIQVVLGKIRRVSKFSTISYAGQACIVDLDSEGADKKA